MRKNLFMIFIVINVIDPGCYKIAFSLMPCFEVCIIVDASNV